MRQGGFADPPEPHLMATALPTPAHGALPHQQPLHGSCASGPAATSPRHRAQTHSRTIRSGSHEVRSIRRATHHARDMRTRRLPDKPMTAVICPRPPGEETLSSPHPLTASMPDHASSPAPPHAAFHRTAIARHPRGRCQRPAAPLKPLVALVNVVSKKPCHHASNDDRVEK